MSDLELKKEWQVLFFILSLIIVSLGQPAWFPLFGLIAGCIGYALFWRVALSISKKSYRFWLSTLWFSSVQLFQLSWFISHPYHYIYAVWALLSLLVGLQFGLLSLLLNPQKLKHVTWLLTIAACWTILEWSRLFLLSGYSWNPIGLSLTGNLYSLQFASLMGVFGLSFVVILTNLLVLRTWKMGFTKKSLCLCILVGLGPYFFGLAHFHYHDYHLRQLTKNQSKQFHVILVQTAFPVEESIHFKDRKEYLQFIHEEWKRILKITKKHSEKSADLIVLPELVVPFGTYTFIFLYEDVKAAFEETFGLESLQALPSLELPLAYQVATENGKQWMVNNAFWTQALSNLFKAGVVIGLEDAEDVGNNNREYYSAALYVVPSIKNQHTFEFQRYAKRVLVPMGEYIPFSFCQDLAAKYGVLGSFTCGKNPEICRWNDTHFGLSICYEEMFGNMMRENKQRGADFLVNITSDIWYPHSKLIRQHLEHSRLRTVENGFPLVRACNTGITCVVDALGRDVAVLGTDDASREDLSEALYAAFPVYNYQTLYAKFGDALIIGICVIILFFFLLANLIPSLRKK